MTYYTVIPHKLNNIAFYEKLILKCSKQRIDKAKQFKKLSDKVISCAAFALLRYALIKEYGFNEMPYFIFNPNGKPVLIGCKGVLFSISHSNNLAAVTVGRYPVGTDIQKRILYDRELADMICSENEKDMLVNGGELTRIWAVKESYFKCIGTGLPNDLYNYDISVPKKEWFTSMEKTFTINELPDAVISVCSQRQEIIREASPYELIKISGG